VPTGLLTCTAPPGTARHIVPMSFGRAGVRCVACAGVAEFEAVSPTIKRTPV